MCRLFGLHAGTNVVTATFWLLDAPDNLAAQSRRNPDGTGLGVFDGHGRPDVRKQPIAAWQDADFATEAHEMTGTTFVAHVRYATTGAHDVLNTHPFVQDGRIFAHNGVLEGLDVLDDRLREVGTADLVLGQTDSERMFALITASIRARGGDVSAGLIDAMQWHRIRFAAHPRLAGNGVDAAVVGGHERRPMLRISVALPDFVDQPVQRPVPTIAHQVSDPRTQLLHSVAEVLDGGGFVDLAPGTDDAAQCGAAITRRSKILACFRVDDDS